MSNLAKMEFLGEMQTNPSGILPVTSGWLKNSLASASFILFTQEIVSKFKLLLFIWKYVVSVWLCSLILQTLSIWMMLVKVNICIAHVHLNSAYTVEKDTSPKRVSLSNCLQCSYYFQENFKKLIIILKVRDVSLPTDFFTVHLVYTILQKNY